MEVRKRAKLMAEHGDVDGLVDLYYEECQLGHYDDAIYIHDLIREV